MPFVFKIFLDFWTCWLYWPWREKGQECTIASSFMNLLLKVNHINGTASLSKRLSHNRQQGFLFSNENHWHAYGQLLHWYHLPNNTSLVHSPQLTLWKMLMHESIHLSSHLLQKPQRSCRLLIHMDTGLSRSNGVLCSWWRIIPFLGAFFHCMNHNDLKS